ncbi:MAG: M20 family metallopeptidase [Lachnospiraceae bacterium]|nr:M20 family metallopeptidase [Lachnospiraceae bacterium]MBQ6855837.1 M20 family metallopeptidase [Lachnospiraceae bacterium]
MEQKILSYYKEHEAQIFEDLKTLTMAEASTSDLDALVLCRKVLERLIKERTGEEPYVYETEGGHDVVRFEYGNGEEKVVLVGHYDTVHPIGSLEYYVDGNELHGPGVYDMKGGLISAIWAVKAYRDLGIDPGKKLVFVFNGDEETGSKDSSDIICELAAGAKAALICEPCTGNGDLKTGRKGTMGFEVTLHGKAAHAGNAHKDGINALEEMAHEILYIQTLTDYEAGTTVNVGVAEGGTKTNVVPDTAVFRVDCRFKSMAERQRVIDAICNMETTVPGATREVKLNYGKVPMEETEGNMALFALAKTCGEKLGLKFDHQFVGGGSDGNQISAMGIPTLDGVGAAGDHAHSPKEYILIDQFLPRMALLASLIPMI